MTGRLTALFAIPGDLDSPTGGYAYARALLRAAPEAGLDLRVMPLPGDFPAPSEASLAATARALAAVRPTVPVLVDGLAFGALPEAVLSTVAAPLAVMLHHPLGLEGGLAPAAAARLLACERAALPHAKAIVVPSAATAADAVAHLGADPALITVASPGLDRPAPTNTPRAEPPLILSVGSLIPRKGHDVLLDALARLSARAWQAVLAGTPDRGGDWAARLAKRATDLGLGDRVRFAGSLERAALDELYGSATLFCLPSRHEGYGMVFAEAMAHGLPVVAADIPAAREVVPPAAGVLVAPEDPAALAAAIGALLDDTPRRTEMARGAAHHAATLPGWPETTARIAAVLRGLSA